MPSIDQFGHDFTATIQPYTHFVSITPSSTNDLGNVSRGIYVSVSGTLVFTGMDDVDGTSVSIQAVAGTEYRIRAKRIWATSSATGIVAAY